MSSRRFSLGWWYDVILFVAAAVFLAFSPWHVIVMALGLFIVYCVVDGKLGGKP